VEQSGGSICVGTEPGKGTTFKIYLPRESSPSAGLERAPALTEAGGTETILVVEDDELVRTVAKRILDAAGYVVLTAANGSEGLQLLGQQRAQIHLVLTDVVMPGMSGRSFAEKLLLSHPGTSVLYMSGYTDNAVLHQGVLDGGAQFLSKPLNRGELLKKVREVLDGRN
jgi:CheY-like chemotaxis protein